MSSIYLLRSDFDNYPNLNYANDAEAACVMDFDGKPLMHRWKPIKVIKVKPGKRRKLFQDGDFPSLSYHMPVFSTTARQRMESLLNGYGEFLPLACKEGEYFVFNVTKVVDGLDIKNCEVMEVAPGVIVAVHRHVFFPNIVRGLTIFKTPTTAMSDVYVNEDFVENVHRYNLQGLSLKPIYSSDEI